jgi:hypothetical protein
MAKEEERRIDWSGVWKDATGLIAAHRSRLAPGASLMLVNRLVGLALPSSSKYIVDEVVIKGRGELVTKEKSLTPLA